GGRRGGGGGVPRGLHHLPSPRRAAPAAHRAPPPALGELLPRRRGTVLGRRDGLPGERHVRPDGPLPAGPLPGGPAARRRTPRMKPRDSIMGPALVLMSGRVLAFAASFLLPVALVRLFDAADFGTYKQLFLVYTTLYVVGSVMAESLFYFLP